MSLSPEKIIETVCPELFGSPSRSVYLGMAEEMTNRGFFGPLYNQAVAYRACHFFTIYGDGQGSGESSITGAGPISSKSEGGLSVSYAVAATTAADSELNNTKYGKMLLGLTRSRPRMGVNTLGGVIQ
jgi:hypothetical protein